MAEHKTGRHLLDDADFVTVINELGEEVSIPKHWVGTDLQPVGLVLPAAPLAEDTQQPRSRPAGKG